MKATIKFKRINGTEFTLTAVSPDQLVDQLTHLGLCFINEVILVDLDGKVHAAVASSDEEKLDELFNEDN